MSQSTIRTRTAKTRAAIRAFLKTHGPVLAMVAVCILVVLHSDPAFAEADPFATARAEACSIRKNFQQFASVVGMVGMVICLMLGYFNKLNWRWLATGIGVSFAINVVPSFVMTLGGETC